MNDIKAIRSAAQVLCQQGSRLCRLGEVNLSVLDTPSLEAIVLGADVGVGSRTEWIKVFGGVYFVIKSFDGDVYLEKGLVEEIKAELFERSVLDE